MDWHLIDGPLEHLVLPAHITPPPPELRLPLTRYASMVELKLGRIGDGMPVTAIEGFAVYKWAVKGPFFEIYMFHEREES